MFIRTILLFSFLLSCFFSFSQHTGSVRILTRTEMAANFGDSLRYEGMPLFRVFEFRDKGGLYNVLLCENKSGIDGNDTSNTRIKAICLLSDHGGFLEKWTISDWLVHEPHEEKHLWFWSKYCSFTDIDRDGSIDPVIVLGSRTEDGEVQRVKIITVHHNRKYPVRAVECVLDDCRQLQFDPAFKKLPASIRQYIDQLLEKLRHEQGLILHQN